MDKSLIKYPIITEKASMLSADRKYVFLVSEKATKPEIKKTLQQIYKVNIENVRIINASPKPTHFGYKIGVKPGYKKAIVTLKEGQKLDVLPHSS